MTGTITAIKRNAVHDGDGLRTTVFFKGCPLKCIWCHNPEGISRQPQVAKFDHLCIGCGQCGGQKTAEAAKNCPADALVCYGQPRTVEDLLSVLLQDKAFYDNSGGGVTLSGGECLAQPEFAAALAKALTEQGIRVNIDTCGFVSRLALEGVIPYADTFLYDLKAIDPEVHHRCTGQDNRIILENLEYLCSQGCKIEIRYPLVMGYNDTECEKIGAFLQDKPGIVKVKVLQYHDFSASRYEALGMENTLPKTVTTPEDVNVAIRCLRSYGLNATKE